MKIVLAEPLGIRQELLESYLEEIRAMGHEVEAFGDRPQNAEALCPRVRGADAVIITNLPFPGEVLRSVSACAMWMWPLPGWITWTWPAAGKRASLCPTPPAIRMWQWQSLP